MFYLIKKDIIIQKKLVVIALVMILCLDLRGRFGFEFVLTVLLVPILLTFGAIEFEQKGECNMALVSLPIKRSTIVLSQYVSIYIYATATILLNLLIQRMIILLDLPILPQIISWKTVVASLFCLTLFSSIMLPLTYKFNSMTSTIVCSILLFLLVSSSDSLIEKVPFYLSNHFSDFELALYGVFFMIIIMVISCLLSLKFFKEHEF